MSNEPPGCGEAVQWMAIVGLLIFVLVCFFAAWMNGARP